MNYEQRTREQIKERDAIIADRNADIIRLRGDVVKYSAISAAVGFVLGLVTGLMVGR